MRFPWRHQYDEAADEAAGIAAITETVGISLTQQHYTSDADINVLMERMGVTKEDRIPVVPISNTILDFSDPIDFREANDRIVRAKDYFMDLPAKTRARFNNDPSQMLDFVMNPANLEESRKMGFLQKPAPEPPPAPTPPTGGGVSSGT